MRLGVVSGDRGEREVLGRGESTLMIANIVSGVEAGISYKQLSSS